MDQVWHRIGDTSSGAGSARLAASFIPQARVLHFAMHGLRDWKDGPWRGAGTVARRLLSWGMALTIYGVLIAAYGYYVWVLGRIGWSRPGENPRDVARVLPFRRRAESGREVDAVAAMGRHASGGSRR